MLQNPAPLAAAQNKPSIANTLLQIPIMQIPIPAVVLANIPIAKFLQKPAPYAVLAMRCVNIKKAAGSNSIENSAVPVVPIERSPDIVKVPEVPIKRRVIVAETAESNIKENSAGPEVLIKKAPTL